MKALNCAHALAAIGAGLAAAAATLGRDRVAVVLLVLIVIDLFVCLQAALILASKPENRP